MREILFRGKSVDGTYWAYGVPMKNGEKTYIVCDIDISKNKYFYSEVDPETVGQYTGENDTDGTKIFEGDIVTVGDNIDFVRYSSGCFRMDRQWKWFEFTNQDFSQIKVIGNKWDNSELLGVKE